MSNDHKIIKLAVLRSDDDKPCPFGLSIPFSCNNVGNSVDKMFPLEESGLEGEETDSVKKANNFLARWQKEECRCKYANKIAGQSVECSFRGIAEGTEGAVPFPAPFYAKNYNNTSFDGLNATPIGYYADYDLSRNNYYGIYSLQGNADKEEINKFSNYIENLDSKFDSLDPNYKNILKNFADYYTTNAVLIKKAALLPEIEKIVVIFNRWKNTKDTDEPR